MDNKTRQKLKKDTFVDTTKHGLEWADENRRSVIMASIAGLVVVLIAIGCIAIYNHRSSEAAAEFSAGMQVYTAPIATSGEPVAPGTKTYATAQDRATAANKIFAADADKYGMTTPGRNALYFAAVTGMEIGQNATAETELKKLSGSMDKDLASLAKSALASLYHQTGRDQQAIDTYNDLIAHPTDVETAGMAKLQLGSLYESINQTDKAKAIYAELKDKDAKGVAGELAAQRLSGNSPAQ